MGGQSYKKNKMKNNNFVKLLFTVFVTCFIIAGCKKMNNDNDIEQTPVSKIEGVMVNKGVVTFANVAVYEKVTQNKSGEWDIINGITQNQHLELLKDRASATNDETNRNFAPGAPITNNFDLNLYSTYLLSILNADKIVSINGYFVKVDMDNIFCSFIDQAAPNAYAELNSNNFSSDNIHVFVDPNEPVLEVLSQMRAGTLSWDNYQYELARKGGGICLKSGRDGIRRQSPNLYLPQHPDIFLYVAASYSNYFLHHELIASRGIVGANWEGGGYIKHTYNYTTSCGKYFAGNLSYTYNINRNDIRVLYSGGTTLKAFNITVWGKFASYMQEEAIVTLN